VNPRVTREGIIQSDDDDNEIETAPVEPVTDEPIGSVSGRERRSRGPRGGKPKARRTQYRRAGPRASRSARSALPPGSSVPTPRSPPRVPRWRRSRSRRASRRSGCYRIERASRAVADVRSLSEPRSPRRVRSLPWEWHWSCRCETL
jgi:hypothetical protein